MVYQAFFNKLNKHYNLNKPFVVFKHPDSLILKQYLQISDAIHTTTDFTETGFVFAPFNINTPSYYIPDKDAECNEITIKPLTADIEETKTQFESSISKDDYIRLIQKAQRNNSLQKVVLSRFNSFSTTAFSFITHFKKLITAYPTAFTFCWYHPSTGFWLGASPEQFLNVERNVAHTVALAGTKTVASKQDWTLKEFEEQQLVTDYIKSVFKAFNCSITIDGPKTVEAGHLQHLKSEVTARFSTSKLPLKELILKLHPTPAVCGLPKSLANAFIMENEGYNRHFYTGFLGELNVSKPKNKSTQSYNTEHNAYNNTVKKTALYVNLRSMSVFNSLGKIYVGGGITFRSDPALEWQETEHKLLTIAKIL